MTDDREERLDEIIAEFLQQQEAGEPQDPAALTAANPEFADEIREFFADQRQMQGIASPLANPVITRRPVLDSIRYFGDYELVEEIARGGMGVVYKARQTSLNRIVAVKMILAGRLAGDDDVKRFQTEAESAANLQHPNIVAVHEVGRHDGQSYFSMDFVDGKNLSEIVRDKPLPAKTAAKYVRQIAEAIHFAHQQGTLHRDLKPSNILIDPADAVQITDFGLAMRVEGNSELTRTGQILGTPSYMPPEQAQNKRGLIGPGSDLYSLGAILYELLTGRPPFRAESAVETLRQVVETEPLSPRLLNPTVPRDLETICLKCLQKEPHKRYGTAEQLADDLRRFLNGEPILARPISRPARLWRWCKRKPAIAGMLAVTTLAVVALVGGLAISNALVTEALDELTTEQNRRTELEGSVAGLERRRNSLNHSIGGLRGDLKTEQARSAALRTNVADLEKRRNTLDQSIARLNGDLKSEQGRSSTLRTSVRALETRREELSQTLEVEKRRLSATYVRVAGAKWETGDLVEAKRYLDLCLPEHRTWIWHFYHKQCYPLVAQGRLESPVKDAESADGPLRNFTLENGRIRFVHTDRKPDLKPKSYGGTLTPFALELGPRGLHARMKFGGESRTGSIKAASLSQDGSRLALGIWFRWRGLTKADQGTIYQENHLVVVDLKADRVAYTMPFHDRNVISIVFSSDGGRLAVVSAPEADPRATRTNTKPNFQPGIWSAGDGRFIRFLPRQSRPISGMAFSEDGNLLAVANDDMTVDVWEAMPFWQPMQLRAETGFVFAVAISPDGRLLASGVGRPGKADPGGIVISDLHEGKELRRLDLDGKGCHRLEFSPDGRLLAAAAASGATVWDPETGEKVFAQSGSFYGIAFSSDGRFLAAISGGNGNPGGTMVWERGSWRLYATLDGHGYAVKFSPDSGRLAITRPPFVGVWKLDRKPVKLFERKMPHNVFDVDYSPDGKRIALAMSTGGPVYVCDADTGKLILQLPAPSALDVAFLTAGDLIATTNHPSAIRFWDAKSGREVLSLKNPNVTQSPGSTYDRPFAVAFSADGLRLAVAWGGSSSGSRGSVQVWDCGVGKQSLVPRWLARGKPTRKPEVSPRPPVAAPKPRKESL